MNNLIFYDTETTGIQRDYSQILQCGSIQTNRDFHTIEEQNISCRPLPWVIPQPGAMLANKKTNLFNSNVSHYQMMLGLNRQWREWTIDDPGIFISFNGHTFDDELIRRQFYWNLLDVYITQTQGNGRLDLLTMMHNLAVFFTDAINIPLFEEGPGISLKLEDLASANGIDTAEAHDAMADCRFMIDLFKLLDQALPEWVDFYLSTATKQGLKNALNANTYLALGEVYRRERFSYPVVICGGDISRPNDIVFFDLSYDPEDIFSLEVPDIHKMVQSNSRDGPLKKYKVNKTIPICPAEMLKDKSVFDMSEQELQKRANLVKENIEFQEHVSTAMADRIFNSIEPSHAEEAIYSGGFPDKRDKDLMDDFHRIEDESHRIKIARNIQDDRYRLFAERLICQMYPESAPKDMMHRFEELLQERLATEGKWGSMDKTLNELEKLLANSDAHQKTILLETQEFIKNSTV